MQTKYICVLIHIWIKGEVGAPWNRFKPSSTIFYWPFEGGTSFVDLFCFCSVLCLLCLWARLFICALWSPAGKGLTFWLSFVVSNCEFVTFPLVSWVRCGTWLYRFLIFAPLLTLIIRVVLSVLRGGGTLKSLPALSFNALIIPILRIVCTISVHYSYPWISSMSCTAFKITRWPIFIPRCITSAFFIPVDLY